MIKVMLEAVSKMLEFSTVPVVEMKVQVACAKTILDKVIEGLPSADLKIKELEPVSNCQEEPQPKPAPKKPIPEGQYKIIKDASNKLVRIDGLALDAKVELDGKIMTHAEAKGKTFTRGRIL